MPVRPRRWSWTSGSCRGGHDPIHLTWSRQVDSAVKTAQKRLYFLRRLKKFGMSAKTLSNFYRCTIESILSGCITAWYGSCSAADRKALQRVVKTAERIIGCHLPSVQGIYNTRCLRKARNIIKDHSHPGYGLLTLLPSGRRYRSIRARTAHKQLFPPGRKASEPATLTHWTVTITCTFCYPIICYMLCVRSGNKNFHCSDDVIWCINITLTTYLRHIYVYYII